MELLGSEKIYCQNDKWTIIAVLIPGSIMAPLVYEYWIYKKETDQFGNGYYKQMHEVTEANALFSILKSLINKEKTNEKQIENNGG